MIVTNSNAGPLARAAKPFLGSRNDQAKAPALACAGHVYYPTDDFNIFAPKYSLQGRDFKDWYVVLSYGYWVIWAYHRPSKLWFGSSDRFSRTTTKQASQTHPYMPVTMLPQDELVGFITGGATLP